MKNLSKDSVTRCKSSPIFTSSCPPYNSSVDQIGSFVIGISGGSASGKTTVASKITESLNLPYVTLLSMDSFYKVLNKDEQLLAGKNMYNFDHPSALDFELLEETIRKLKDGQDVEVPIYNFVTNARESHTKTMYGAKVIIFEGIFAFYFPSVLKMLDMKIFVDTEADVRLARRLQRDITERGRELESVLTQYKNMVKPAFCHYIAPSMIHADVIVPRGGDNAVAIKLIINYINTQLQLRGL